MRKVCMMAAHTASNKSTIIPTLTSSSTSENPEDEVL